MIFIFIAEELGEILAILNMHSRSMGEAIQDDAYKN